MLRSIVILSILLCLSMVAKGQDDADAEDEAADPVVDSLLREYAKPMTDSARIRLCRKICYASDNLDTIIKYSGIGISLCGDKDSANLAACYEYAAWAYNYAGQKDLAIAYYQKATEISKAIGMLNDYVLYSVNLSTLYRGERDYRKMWLSIYDALRVAQQNADTANMCYCYFMIADYYDDLDAKELGVEAAMKGLQLAQQSNRYEDMGAFASLLALLKATVDDDSTCREGVRWGHLSLDYFDKAGELEEFYAEKKCNAYIALIEISCRLAELTGDMSYADSAEHYIAERDSFLTANMIDNEEYTIISRENTALVKSARRDYHGAVKLLLETVEFAKDVDVNGYTVSLYRDLYVAYEKLGDYRNAKKYLNLYREEKETVSGVRVAMEAAAFLTKSHVDFENEVAEYEKNIAEKKLEGERKHFRRMMIVSVAGFVALLVFVFFIWKMLRNTRKGNASLISHNEEIKTQNEVLNAEKSKLASINSKIRQSMRYARRIQMATVSSEAEIEEVFPDALVYYKPCEIVSGDWYWTARLGSKRILALGGSAKNGVPGALVSMLTVNALKDTVGQLSAMSSVSPSAILRTVQRKLPVVARNNAAGLSLCIFGRGSVRFAGVNQNAVLLKNGNTLVMRGDQPGDMFNTVTEGDVVMVYSASTRRELIARSTTPEMFCAALSQKTTVEQKGAIEELMSQKEQNEDVTIVSIII